MAGKDFQMTQSEVDRLNVALSDMIAGGQYVCGFVTMDNDGVTLHWGVCDEQTIQSLQLSLLRMLTGDPTAQITRTTHDLSKRPKPQ